MPSIMIMDRDFTLQGELAVYQSLTYTRSYWGIGTFSLTTAPDIPGASALIPGHLLWLAGEPDKMMLLEDIRRDSDNLTASGVQLKGLIRRRIVVPPLSLPTTLWRYTVGAWRKLSNPDTIREAMQGIVWEGYARPDSPTEGMVWLDMRELAAVYSWGTATDPGGVWLDLETARIRQKYQDFGWDRYSGPAESAYKHYAKGNLASPEDSKRAVPRLAIAPDQGRGLALPWQGRFDALADLYASIGEATGMGWDIRPDFAGKRFVLDAWQGRDLAAVISREMGNAADVQLQVTHSGSLTTLYVGGAGEDEHRMILSQGNDADGWDRREGWGDAGSVDDTAMLRLYADKRLAEGRPKETLTAQVIDSGACRYGRDWDVGDVVTVRGAGASMRARIIEVTETHEDGQRTIAATFGSAPVTMASAIRSIYGGAAR